MRAFIYKISVFIFLFTLLNIGCQKQMIKSDATAMMPTVVLETNSGDIEIQLNPQKAPISVENFLQYVNSGFYNECAFFRVIEGFMAQVGINGNPDTQTKWRDQTIQDDPA